MRILIAIDNNEGLDSKLSAHFGHCSYFGVYETETKDLKIIRNEIDHSNHEITPVDQIIQLKPDIVFSLGIGQRALKLFEQKCVTVKTGNFKNIKEVLNNIDSLKELTTGCVH